MPIYEYYCPDNHRIYQFYAKTLAQGRSIPKCPDHPGYRMIKSISAFAVLKWTGKETAGDGDQGEGSFDPPAGAGDDPRTEAALAAMEGEFANVDENDPRAMGRMMRRMAEATGEKIDGEMEEVVRKLEEGTDPEALEEQLGGEMPGAGEAPGGGLGEGGAKQRLGDKPLRLRGQPRRDPKLYDYE